VDSKYGNAWSGWCSNECMRDIWGGAYGRISGEVGMSFLVILDLRSVMAPKLDYGMTCGVGIIPAMQLF
jgi:hypothetical protein